MSVTKDISKMSVPLGDLNSIDPNQADQFQLLFAEMDGGNLFPIFFNLKDELYIAMLGNMIYDYGISHIGETVESLMTDKNKFMFSLPQMNFKSHILPNELLKYREIFFVMCELPMMKEFFKANLPMVISISTENSGKAVNINRLSDYEIRFDVDLTGKE